MRAIEFGAPKVKQNQNRGKAGAPPVACRRAWQSPQLDFVAAKDVEHTKVTSVSENVTTGPS